jgi:tripeptide aminopeptidase
MIVEELTSTGAQDVTLTKYSAAVATIPATSNSSAPTVAHLALLDTAPQFNCTNIKPIVHRKLCGAIVLPDNRAVVLSPVRFSYFGPKTALNCSATKIANGFREVGSWERNGDKQFTLLTSLAGK